MAAFTIEPRMSIRDLEPDAYDTFLNLEKYIGSTGLDRRLRELIRIRASQINGCAYCIQLHTTEALQLGEEERRIYALSAWHESPLFTPEERAVLAMTDEITDISLNGLTEETGSSSMTIPSLVSSCRSYPSIHGTGSPSPPGWSIHSHGSRDRTRGRCSTHVMYGSYARIPPHRTTSYMSPAFDTPII